MLKDKSWKEVLLKSSLPFESLVTEILAKFDLEFEGEYSYLRPNEQGIQTEFSVDISARKWLN